MAVQKSVIHNIPLHREDGTFAIWDHPNFYAEATLPEKFLPGIGLQNVLSRVNSWPEERKQERMIILKVIGDAICANEQQIRRYLAPLMSASTVSEQINFLRRHGFVQRYRCFVEGHEDEEGQPIKINVPAPLNLGIAGYTLLKFYYSDQFFMEPDAWISQNSSAAIQRFVAMNEIRCMTVEKKLAKEWKWYPKVGRNAKYKRPLAYLQIGEDTPEEDSRAWLVFERAQTSQNFVGFLKDRLNLYRHIYENEKRISLSGMPADGEMILVLSCATVRIAKLLQEEIGLHKFPFEVWVLVDEWFDNEGAKPITHAFGKPYKTEEGYVLKRFILPI